MNILTVKRWGALGAGRALPLRRLVVLGGFGERRRRAWSPGLAPRFAHTKPLAPFASLLRRPPAAHSSGDDFLTRVNPGQRSRGGDFTQRRCGPEEQWPGLPDAWATNTLLLSRLEPRGPRTSLRPGPADSALPAPSVTARWLLCSVPGPMRLLPARTAQQAGGSVTPQSGFGGGRPLQKNSRSLTLPGSVPRSTVTGTPHSGPGRGDRQCWKAAGGPETSAEFDWKFSLRKLSCKRTDSFTP